MTINFNAPTPKEYQAIVRALAQRHGLTMDAQRLSTLANAWEVRHGGFSGRAAEQFIRYLQSQEET